MDAETQFQKLLWIVARLRGPGGCPWDQEQTQSSLTQFVIEEAYELVEAIERGVQSEIQEELGDYLFQVILQAQVAKDESHFNIEDVIFQLNEKMLHRHPHVFGETGPRDLEQVWLNWEQLKKEERQKKSSVAQPIFNYPQALPALQAAHKIGVKSEGYRFDWENAEQVVVKLDEEVQELKKALDEKHRGHIEHEIGDVLFSVAQLSRNLKMESEQCLREANRRFARRFNEVMRLSGLEKETFRELPAEKMQEYWEMAKQNLSAKDPA